MEAWISVHSCDWCNTEIAKQVAATIRSRANTESLSLEFIKISKIPLTSRVKVRKHSSSTKYKCLENQICVL